MSNYHFTSESVSEGHPDKIADQISDAILDAYLRRDFESKVACECLITTSHLIIAGEITSTANVDVIAIAKNVIKRIGYDNEEIGFDYSTATYTNLLHQQSPEINESVSDGGAGDQGLMFGYACNETPELMPLPITLAHRMMQKQSELRKNKTLKWLLPDAKSQVTVLYKNDKPVKVEKVVISTQHKKNVTQATIRKEVIKHIIEPVIKEYLPGSTPEYLINPSGSFTIGGPNGDTGLTGRKIIVDTYGGICSHGGGAFSGKDPSKVDRSGAYAARYIAKHVVAAKLAKRCTIQLSYAIGVAEPTSIYVNTHGTGKISDEILEGRIRKTFDLTPKGINYMLKLRNSIYEPTAAYGHFGKECLSWEKLDYLVLESLKFQKGKRLSRRLIGELNNTFIIRSEKYQQYCEGIHANLVDFIDDTLYLTINVSPNCRINDDDNAIKTAIRWRNSNPILKQASKYHIVMKHIGGSIGKLVNGNVFKDKQKIQNLIDSIKEAEDEIENYEGEVKVFEGVFEDKIS